MPEGTLGWPVGTHVFRLMGIRDFARIGRDGTRVDHGRFPGENLVVVNCRRDDS